VLLQDTLRWACLLRIRGSKAIFPVDATAGQVT
jgi:hypothetical protein